MPSNQHSFIVHAALIFQPTQFVFCRLQPSHEQLMEQETAALVQGQTGMQPGRGLGLPRFRQGRQAFPRQAGFSSKRHDHEKSAFNEALFSWLAKAVQP